MSDDYFAVTATATIEFLLRRTLVRLGILLSKNKVALRSMINHLISRIKNELQGTFNEVLLWIDSKESLLDYRSSNESWSIRQILEHISLTNHYLLILIRKGVVKSIEKSNGYDYSFLLENYDLNWDQLKSIGNHKSFVWNRPDHMEPTGELSLAEIKFRLNEQLNECLELLNQIKNGEGVLFKATMTVNNLGKIDVYHYIYFLIQHSKRHITQMKKMESKMQRNPDVISHEDFIASIYHVVYIGNTCRRLSSAMVSLGKVESNEEKQVIRLVMQSKVMIDTISLIDELNNFLFKYNPDAEAIKSKIKSYRYIVQPAIDQVNRWEDFRRFRSNVLAHSFRDNRMNYRSVHLSNTLHEYNIPLTAIDLGILFKLLDVITKLVEDIFSDEYQEALQIIDSFEKPKKRTSQSLDEEVEKINEVLQIVNARIEEYTKGNA